MHIHCVGEYMYTVTIYIHDCVHIYIYIYSHIHINRTRGCRCMSAGGIEVFRGRTRVHRWPPIPMCVYIYMCVMFVLRLRYVWLVIVNV